ncbi:MAG: 4Fe-4S dicluster domain-containing protein [Trueperaceae bacterium]|nr:4Fe-4S dicluster domain-containing protein [Trueperaceae bacterium]
MSDLHSHQDRSEDAAQRGAALLNDIFESANTATSDTHRAGPDPQWIKVIDHRRCIGCHACTTACKSENEVPLGVNRTYVKHVEKGAFPDTRRSFQVTRCNQCEDPPCVAACPVTAMYQRGDGIVDFDKDACIGCKACIAACPYDAIFINPEDGSAEKCNMCSHRLDVGLEPACVSVCPAEAILVGDLHEPTGKVAQHVGRDDVAVRRPEKDTKPKLYYLGVDQATLDPLAAGTPPGGMHQWSEQPADLPHQGGARLPAGWSTSNAAAAMLTYDVSHQRPWDERVSLYTWTKSISAGMFLMALVAIAFGWLDASTPLAQWVAPLTAGFFLAVTGALLIWDLAHPLRFFKIFLRPQWRSWLTRGAFIIGAFGAVLVAWLAASWLGASGVQRALAWVGVPLALATAVYTAYLFAQAKARDLWQSPLLPTHMAVQAVLAGSAALALAAVLTGAGDLLPPMRWILAASTAAHGLIIASELALPSVTAHARTAERHMTHGAFRRYFLGGLVGGSVLPLLLCLASGGGVVLAVASLLALGGLLAYEHAFVQAGQAVPLA